MGLPQGFKAWSSFPFAGLNQSASRPAIDDKEFFWLENYLRIGDGYLRTLWDAGAAFYTAPGGKTIVSFFWFNIGAQVYVAVFLSDGTAVQVAYPSAAQTTISSTALTFYNTANGQLPTCCQSGTQYLLIANHNTQNDYWIWDGTLLYAAGGIAPVTVGQITDGGSGYTSVPSYTVYGGTGSGVVLTPVVADGSVVAITVDNPGSGYLPGQIVQVAFSGGGSDDTPILEAVLATSGVIDFLTLVAAGSGFPTGTFPLSFTGGGGTGAAGTFTTSGGTITGISLTNGGSGYTSTPAVGFPIPGSGAAITATVAAGAVTTLAIASGGSGYVPGTYPLAFSGPGSGAQATYTVNASGVVASTTPIAGGTGYTVAPTVTLPAGSGAAVVASVTGGSVGSVTIVDGGTNLTGTPTITFVGGDGTGAAGTLTITSGAITAVTMTNGGSGYTSAPAVEVETGVNNAAAAILQLMPFGVSGTSIETYQARAWISYPNQQGKQNNGGTFFVSAPQSQTDFATSDGGDIFTNTDRYLRAQYTFLRQTSNFLYAIGDSSASVISNVQTGGSPTTTTFSYQNTDPQIGSSWRDTAQDFSNTILFANALGIYGLYGGSVRKVSKKLDRLFTNAVLPPTAGALTPTAAVANVYTQLVYLLLITITDPFTFKPRNVMLGWDGTEPFVVSQGPALTYIGTQEINSNPQAWGTDGASLYPLLNRPSASLVKVVASKQFGGNQSFMIKMTHSLYIDAEDLSSGQGGLSFSGSIDADGLAVPVVNSVTQALASCPSGSYPFAAPLSFVAPRGQGAVYACGVGAGMPQVPAVGVGLTMASSSPDFVLRNITVGYLEQTAIA
jgi:hypothetical protein